ncbi:LuxR C-terminal-related transcriptional regulator [Paraburkholderia sp. J67]|uniref:LuxR C-terminal-related transcriptional regulator n=1 Tax=Paraburkholderia sp. J67 TaxID=2805435 RepID=UPI002ABD659A|nr:LuxR C-terminal-related transcriptional regulator [Paraburkholderia sp. J67]
MPESPDGARSAADDAPLKSVIDTKLVPPRIVRGVVTRESMLTRLTQARRQRCFVLQGPAGYGKTTTLAAWCRSLMPLGYDVAWLSLAPEDDSLPVWLRYVTRSVAAVSPAMTREAEELEDTGNNEAAAERTVIALVRGIAQHRRELVLVLDDLHYLKDRAIHTALQWLLDYAPDNLHLVLASRSSVPVSLDRLRVEGQVLEFGAADLRFSEQESTQFLNAQLGSIDDASAQHLHALTDGWAAGLQLFSVAWKRRRRGAPKPGATSRFFHNQLRDTRAFARYFDEEVLNRLAPDDLDLLVCVSACNRFCASLCAALRDDAHAGANLDVNRTLERLEADNLFVSTVDRSEWETWYALHPLLRESLTERFDAWDAAARHAIHAKASQWFHERGHLDEAIRHALSAGEPARAAAMIEQSAQTLFLCGDRAKLMRLMRELPDEHVQASVPLRSWMAHVQMYWREFDACAATLDALDATLSADRTRARFTATVLRAGLEIHRDNVDGVQRLEAALTAIPDSAEQIITTMSRHVFSWLYLQRGEYQRAREVQFDAPVVTIDGAPLIGSIAGSLFGRCFAGLAYAYEGNLAQAEPLYRSVLRDAQLKGRACHEAANLATALLGEILVERNEFRAARDLLENRVDTLERVSLPDAVLRIMMALANAHWGSGHRLDALAYLERLEEYAAQLGLDRLIAHSLGAQIACRLAIGESNAALAALERLGALDNAHRGGTGPVFSEIHFVAQSALIQRCLTTGDLEQAVQRLAPLIAWCETHGRQRERVSALMQRGVTLSRLGRHAAARADVVDALQRGHRLGLCRTLMEAAPDALALIVAVNQDGATDPVVTFYVERLQARAAQGAAREAPLPDAHAPGASIPKLSQRETDVVRLLAEAFTAKKIARTLGLSPETVKWHLANIYGKLGVSGRDEALDRLRDIQWGSGPGFVRAKPAE